MIENVIEKIIQIILRREPLPPTPRELARMNAPPPIDEVMFAENENEKDDFSEVGDIDEQTGFSIESYLYDGRQRLFEGDQIVHSINEKCETLYFSF